MTWRRCRTVQNRDRRKPLRRRAARAGFPALSPGQVFRRRGIALVTVLWVLTLLALIAANFATSTRTEVNLARNLVESAKAEALAEAGVYHAVLGLLGQAGEEEWRVDGTVYAWLFGGGEIRVAIHSESGKIDLNTADDQILRAFFRSFELEDQDSDALVDALIDFRDTDDLRQVNGAEDSDYRAADLKHDAKDWPLESVEELQQVLGMTRELYDRAAPSLTIFSRMRTPQEALATPEVKAAITGAEAEPETQGADEPGADGTADDGTGPEVVTAEELTETPQVLAAGGSDARADVPVYTVHSEGRAPSGAVFALDAVIRLTSDIEVPFQVFLWQRGSRQLFTRQFETAEDEETE